MKSGFIWENKDRNLLFFPVAFLLAVMPFVIRATQHFLHGELRRLFSTDSVTEIFAQYRARFLWIMAAVMLVLLYIFGKRIFCGLSRIDWLYFGLCGIFLLFLVLSTVFSDNRDTALWGLYDRAEGMVTQIGYLVLFLYASLTCCTSRDLKLLLAAVGVVIAANAVTGISQFAGHNLLTSEWANRLIVPDDIEGTISDFGSTRMYGMVGHYNYVGSLTAAVLPLCTVLALFEKKWKFRIPALVMAALSLMLLLGSTSRAGLIGTAAAVILSAIFFRRLLLRYWKILLLGFGVLLAAVVGINFVLDNAILERVPMLFADIKTIFSDTSDFDYKDHIFIRGVENREDGAVLLLQDNCLQLSVENGALVFRDQNGQEVLYTENGEGTLETENSVFAPLSFVPANGMSQGKVYTNLSLIYNGRRLMQFYYDDSQIYFVRKDTMEKTTLLEPPVAGFLKGKELIGSMRGYIWSRTIPMLPRYLLTGAGPDCYIFEFPQDDILGKLYAYGNGTIVVDKPHNLYLQIFVNEGGVALLAFLAICALYFWDCFRLYGGKDQKRKKFRPIAVALGVAGYLFAGLFNDSTVLTAVLFWVLLGAGVGMNRQYRRESENQ